MTTISYTKNTTESKEMDTISLDSNELSDLGFEDAEPEQKTKSKEIYKTIYGGGEAAEKMRIRQ